LARRYEQRRRDCNEEEYRQCGEQCAGKPVRVCKVTESFKPRVTRFRDSGSTTVWDWVIVHFDCRCQEPGCEDDSAFKKFLDWLVSPRPKPEPDPFGDRPKQPRAPGQSGIPGFRPPLPVLP
jgi:hypothetical protein